MPDGKSEIEQHSTLFKWLIGLGVAGVAAVGAWVGAALNQSFAREEKIREYLQQEIDKGRTERVDLAKAITALADGSNWP